MATIIFAITESISHYNASYKIANHLKKQGHRIVYVGDNNRREKEVLSQNFQFEIIYGGFFKSLQKSGKGNFFSRIGNLPGYMKTLIEYKKALIKGDEIKKLIDKFNPDLFIIDVFLGIHAVSIYKFKVKTILLQTYLATDKDKMVPPLNSDLIPDKTWINNFSIEFLWARHFLRKRFFNLLNKIILLGLDRNSMFKAVAKSNRYPNENINYKRAFHTGLSNVPELILGAREFDFPRDERPNRYFVGPMVEFDRRDVLYDDKYLEVILQKEINLDDEVEKPLIYCSLGTLNSQWCKNPEAFFKMLIDVFTIKKEYELFLSVGPDINPEKFTSLPDNVKVFKLVPQLDILERASLMITHGGINSINECVFLGVPMIVYPLSNEIDQPGNAARVEYHGIGIKGKIGKETTAGLINKIDKVLSDPSFKINITKMQSIYNSYGDVSKTLNIIESYILTDAEFA